MGILASDALHRRLLEDAAAQLGLAVTLLDDASMEQDDFTRFDLVVADQAKAEQLHRRLSSSSGRCDGVQTAVVSIAPERSPQQHTVASTTDGVLVLPQEPASLLAQLSALLYVHRANARRYRSAMDELNLNRRIFRSVTSSISIVDARKPDLPVTYVNPAFEAMTGYSLEEIRGRNFRFLHHPEPDQPELARLREAIAAGRQTTVVLHNFRKDGSSFWNELSLAPVRNH